MSDPSASSPSPPPDPPIRAENLEYLKKQAKTLLRRSQEGDSAATARLGLSPKLADALHAVARDAGFQSWPKLQDELRFRDQIRRKHRLGTATLQNPRQSKSGDSMSTSTQSLNLGPIDQIGMTCTDLDAAQKFYCDLLGLRLAGDVPGAMKFFDCDGVNIIMFKKEKIEPSSVLYFKVPGEPGLLEEKVGRLKSQSVKMETDAHVIARNWNGYDVWMVFFRDPFGNLLALKSDVPSSAK